MKYELQELDDIITVTLKPRNFIEQKNKPALIKKCKETVCTELKRIKSELLQEILNCENEKRIIFYVQEHQHGCVKLSDTLEAYLSKTAGESIHKYSALKIYVTQYKSLLEGIEELNYFIRQRFIQWYDNNFKITDHLRRHYIKNIIGHLSKITVELEGRDISDELLSLAIQPFRNFMNEQNIILQVDLDYFFYYQGELLSFMDKGFLTNENLRSFLYDCNYNSRDFFDYYTKSYDGTNESAEFLYYQLKLINQFPIKHTLKYQPALPCIQEQISTWLAEEIYFLEKKQQFTNVLSSPTLDNPAISEKLQTNLSVSNLSLGIKLLLDTGIIKTQNTTEFLRTVARNFRTEKSETISEASLRNKAYNIESATALSMKNVIIELLNEVRKY